MQLACKNCGHKAEISSLITAAQEKCQQCGQLLMGLDEPAAYDDLPAAKQGRVNEDDQAPPMDPQVLLPGLIAGGLIGPTAVLMLYWLRPIVPIGLVGMIMGALCAVIIVPLMMLFYFIYGVVKPYSIHGVVAEGILNQITDAIFERRHGKLTGMVGITMTIALLLGALLGSRATEVGLGLMLLAALGALIVGGSLGAIVVGRMATKGPASDGDPPANTE